MAKVHYRDNSVTQGMFYYMQREYELQGFRGAACGYFRKRTTTNKDEVTCFYCKQKLLSV
jgi:hypothetical protein